jgi:hypothetical protein
MMTRSYGENLSHAIGESHKNILRKSAIQDGGQGCNALIDSIKKAKTTTNASAGGTKILTDFPCQTIKRKEKLLIKDNKKKKKGESLVRSDDSLFKKNFHKLSVVFCIKFLTDMFQCLFDRGNACLLRISDLLLCKS